MSGNTINSCNYKTNVTTPNIANTAPMDTSNSEATNITKQVVDTMVFFLSILSFLLNKQVTYQTAAMDMTNNGTKKTTEETMVLLLSILPFLVIKQVADHAIAIDDKASYYSEEFPMSS